MKIEINYLAPGDVLKGRVEPILWMKTCEWMSRLGARVRLYSPYFYRKENISFSCIRAHFGVSEEFEIRVLPAALSTSLSGTNWTRVNLAVTFFVALWWKFARRNEQHQIFFSKSQICMQVVLFLEKLFGRRVLKIYELHSLGENSRLEDMLQKMDLVIANSKIVQRRLEQRGIDPCRILVVYNASFAHLPEIGRDAARGRLNVSLKALVLAYVGKLYESNVLFFLEVAERLQRMDAEIHIVGGNPKILQFAEAEKTKRQLNNIVFHGFVAPVAVGVYMKMADFLFCSYSDDLPNIEQATPAKYFDYMQSGRPFFCSNNTAIREILAEGKNCYFFEPENADSLVESLIKHKDDYQGHKHMALSNKRLLAEIDWPVRSRKIFERVQKLCQSPF